MATILITLIRLGVGVQKYRLPEGATLADLLNRAGVSTANQGISIDGIVAETTAPLRAGALVSIIPEPSNGALDEPWRATIPSFQDNELFRQYTEILKARRQDLGPDEGSEE
jgi:hypothetical protein